mmetsp:Transcript_10409/g.31206  ORF Transcript_10409/g.31206 Transcript_10409/m.31206 type:complete len:229 (-) Transcript_10409:373-1059(-)
MGDRRRTAAQSLGSYEMRTGGGDTEAAGAAEDRLERVEREALLGGASGKGCASLCFVPRASLCFVLRCLRASGPRPGRCVPITQALTTDNVLSFPSLQCQCSIGNGVVSTAAPAAAAEQVERSAGLPLPPCLPPPGASRAQLRARAHGQGAAAHGGSSLGRHDFCAGHDPGRGVRLHEGWHAHGAAPHLWRRLPLVRRDVHGAALAHGAQQPRHRRAWRPWHRGPRGR